MKNRFPGGRAAALLLLSLLLLSCKNWFVDEAVLMNKVSGYLQQRNYNAAAIELRNVLKANPNNAEARYRLAEINLDFGDFPAAEKEYRRAEQVGWNTGQTRIGIARCMIGMARFKEVLDNIRMEDSWSAAERADLLALYAVSEAGLGNKAEADRKLNQAQQLAPETKTVMKTRVQLAIVTGQQENVWPLLDAALARYPGDPELMLLQAAQLVSAERSDEARKIYQQVVDSDPQGFISAFGRNARLRLAQLLVVAGELDKAEALIRPLYRRDSNDPFTNYLGGLIAYQQGKFPRAEELLLKVLKLAPEHNPTRLLFGTVSFAEQHYEQAAYFIGKYLDAEPNNLIARKLLARSYIQLGRAEDAAGVLKGLVSETTTDTELLTLAGLTELKRGARDSGIAGLEKALSISPGNAGLRNELARAYIESGETELAVHELQSMLKAGDHTQQTETLLVLAHLRAGEYTEAINRVLGMISSNPGDALAEALAGSVLASSGDRVEARRHLNKALQIKPGLPPAVLTLAQLEELDGKLDAAEALYKQLVDRKLNSALPMLALARVAEQKHDREGMLSWLEQAVEYAPNDIKPRLFLAEFHLRNGAPELAQAQAEKALQLAPHQPDVLLTQARVQLVQQQYGQAQKTLGELFAVAPDSVPGHTLMGNALIKLERLTDARRELQTALSADPDNLNALALMVSLEIGAQHTEQAQTYARRIQQAYPELYLGYELMGDAVKAGNDLGTAAQQYELAWDRLPSEDLAIKRADVASRRNNYSIATDILSDWLKTHPDSVRARQFLGETWQSAGKPQRARAEYEHVLNKDPNNLVALNNLAVLNQSSDMVKALQLAERAWRLDSGNAGIQDTYGWLLVQAGQMERGLPLLEKARKTLAGVAEVRYHYAVALYRSGDKQQGRSLLQKLLDENQDFEGRDDAQRLLQGG